MVLGLGVTGLKKGRFRLFPGVALGRERRKRALRWLDLVSLWSVFK